MEEYITSKCIIEEYLNNWFTYEELAQYLCIPVNDVIRVLDIATDIDSKARAKISRHKEHIEKYRAESGKTYFITDDNSVFVEIAEYIIQNHTSIRQTANHYGIGKTTCFDYIHEKLPDISISLYKQVCDVLTDNKSFSTNNKKVIDQVMTSYELLLSGKKGHEISQIQGVGRNVVQRNLTRRLKVIDSSKYDNALRILNKNRELAIAPDGLKTNGK